MPLLYFNAKSWVSYQKLNIHMYTHIHYVHMYIYIFFYICMYVCLQSCQSKLNNIFLTSSSYTYDRDGKFGFNFFCQHHFGMVGRVSKTVPGVIPKVPSKDQKDHAEVSRTLAIDKKSAQALNRGKFDLNYFINEINSFLIFIMF